MIKPAERRDIGSYLGKIGQARYPLRIPIEGWTATEAEYCAPGNTKMIGGTKPIQTGESWWAQTLYFMADVTVNNVFDGLPVYLNFLCDGECLLFVDGEPAQGLDLNHTLCRLGEGCGQTVGLCVEATNRWQNHAHAVQGGVDYPAQVFRKADLVTVDEDIEKLYYALSCLYETETDFAMGWLLKARRLVHPDASRDEFLASTKAFLAELLPALEQTQGAKSSRTILAAGHSHLDIGYLWPVKETVRKLGRTLASMLYLLDTYPEFHFTQSQAILFEWAKRYFPELYVRLKEHVKQGRFEIVGGMYVEADANMVSAEAYIRQFLYGQHFFMQEFGHMSTVGWLPDTFGLSAMLPQILKKSGLTSFFSAKLRSNVHYAFPHTLYLWEGLDGSRVTANLSPHGTYNGLMTVEEIKKGEKTDTQKSPENNMQLYCVGHGDGGGGVTQDMLERARFYDKIPLLPRLKWAQASQYFAGVQEQALDLPVWRGEKYFDLHQGTLTTQAALKRGNRKSELALLSAEILDVMAGGGQAEVIKELWKTLLLNQFHDIITGSCQNCVADVANEELRQLLMSAADLQKESMGKIAAEKSDGFVTVFNTLSFDRSGYVDINGETLYAENVPAMGYQVLRVEEMRQTGVSIAKAEAGSIVLENGFVRAVISSDTGEITSMFDKQAGREALKSPGNRFLLYDEVYEFYDAWNIHHETLLHPQTVNTPCTLEIVENSGVQAVVRLSRRITDKSLLTQEIVLPAKSHRMEFRTHVDWRETGKMLKVLFDVDVYAPCAQYDLSYGNIARSTGDNMDYEASQIEVCAHKWADLSDAKFGVALLNDCKYGYRIKGSQISLTLLKAPKYPDPQADMGAHVFTYAICPHKGDFREGCVDREGYDLNQPLIAAEGMRPGKECKSFLAIHGSGVYAGALKFSHDKSGDLILRLYENHGARAEAQVDLSSLSPSSVWACDMIEGKEMELVMTNAQLQLAFTPYEIKTIRLRH
ncbi:MAG: alpha-mannosidase [Christensenellales bacterium]|jgi:alpha-mannosidase